MRGSTHLALHLAAVKVEEQARVAAAGQEACAQRPLALGLLALRAEPDEALVAFGAVEAVGVGHRVLGELGRIKVPPEDAADALPAVVFSLGVPGHGFCSAR